MKTVKRNPRAEAILKNKHANGETSGLIERYSDRQSRHDARQQLRTGKWMEDDQYESEAPPAAFEADLVGESMPQNPEFGVRLEVAL